MFTCAHCSVSILALEYLFSGFIDVAEKPKRTGEKAHQTNIETQRLTCGKFIAQITMIGCAIYFGFFFAIFTTSTSTLAQSRRRRSRRYRLRRKYCLNK